MGKELIVDRDLAERLAKEDWVKTLWFTLEERLKSEWSESSKEPYRELTISAKDIKDYDEYLTLIAKIKTALSDYNYKLSKEFYDNNIYLMTWDSKQKFKIHFSVVGDAEKVFSKISGCKMHKNQSEYSYSIWSCKT